MNMNPGSVKQTPIDVLGTLGIGAAGTWMAAQNPNLRWTVGGVDSAWRDYRFIATLGGAATYLLGGGQVARAGYDVMMGAGGSFLNTEMIRRAAIQRAQGGGGMAAPQPQPAQIPQATAGAPGIPMAPGFQGAPAFAGVQGFGCAPGSFR